MVNFNIASLMLNHSCKMQNADVQLREKQRSVLRRVCLNLLRSLLKICKSTTNLQDDFDLIAETVGAMIRVIKKPTLPDNLPDMAYDALICLYYLTFVPERQEQALRLTVDEFEGLLSAALTMLEDDARPDEHRLMAVGKARSAPLCFAKPKLCISAI